MLEAIRVIIPNKLPGRQLVVQSFELAVALPTRVVQL
jgi:hypothetical protein